MVKKFSGYEGLFLERLNKVEVHFGGILEEHVDESLLDAEQAERIDQLLAKSKEFGNQFAKEHWGIEGAYEMDPIELRKAIDAAEDKQKQG